MRALDDLPLFAGLDAAALQTLAQQLVEVRLPGGAILFEEGSAADGLYVLRSGQLAAFRGRGASRQWLGGIRPGEAVGEMALLSGRPRSAHVVALRDSTLLRLGRADFDELVLRHPQAALELARTAFARMEASLQQRLRPRVPVTLALLPQSAGVEIEALAESLAESLGRYGPVALVRRGDALDPARLSALEDTHAQVIYVGGPAADAWAATCRRQADALLLVVDSREAPVGPPASPTDDERLRQRWLVLAHHGQIRDGTAARWRSQLAVDRQVHVRDGRDLDRLARMLVGRSVGVVFSGGGARGFAHLGVLRAFHEAGLSIDQVGGTSFGAIVAAAVAQEWGIDEMHARLKHCFVENNPLDDWTVPLVALTRGVKASELLKAEFGSAAIEDLPLPFYCVSANLSRGDAHTHQQGTLWLALRASIAIPGVLPPVFEGGEVLVDGGVINNLPADVMYLQSAGPLIGVDIAGEHALVSGVDGEALPNLFDMTTQWLQGRRRPSMLRILIRAGMVNSKATTRANRQKLNLLLQPPVDDIDLLDWAAADRAIAAGYRYTAGLLESAPEWFAGG